MKPSRIPFASESECRETPVQYAKELSPEDHMKRLIHYLHPVLSPLGLFLLLALTWHSTANAVTSASTDMVQKSYIGFYHRPADPGGLIYWTEKLDSKGGDMPAIIAAFANSAEARARHGTVNSGNISTFIGQIHLALFNRNATAEELNFYSNGFNTGRFTSATIMLTVLNNAQGDDLLTINNKLAAANQFTWTIDPELDGQDYLVTYAGDEADFPAACDFLDAVILDSSTIPTQSQTTAYIQAYIADPGDPVLDSLSPPSTPTDFLIAASSSSRIDLSWSASTDNIGVAGYKIYRDGAYLKSVTGTSASDTGLTARIPYCYKVSAYDAVNMESPQGTLACVTTQSDDAVSTTAYHHLLLIYPHTDVENGCMAYVISTEYTDIQCRGKTLMEPDCMGTRYLPRKAVWDTIAILCTDKSGNRRYRHIRE